MADAPISEELTALKKRARRRLVGAVALVLLALVVLWTVMDDKPPQSLVAQPVAIVSSSPALSSTVAPSAPAVPIPEPAPQPAPSQPVAATAPPVTPPALAKPATEPKLAVVDKPAEKPASKPETKPAQDKKPEPEKKPEAKHAEVKRDPARILAGMEAETKPKPAAKPAAEKEKVAATGDDKAQTRFFLALGAFADKDKAEGLIGKAKQAGVSAQTETVKTDKGVLTRLRAGPYPSREAAEKAHAKLASAGVTSSIVSK
ncbi:SPOR domain-containing protein [Chitinimonas sp.]|uniref:SPOR domain-containing protein n=1 Tax=Chitinimonas sp. TaxID=1934313 RepID=UPI002F9492C7